LRHPAAAVPLEPRQKPGDRRWLAALGAAAEAAGRPELPARLLHLLSVLMPHDMALVCRYTSDAAPDFLVCEGVAPHLVALYRAGLWRYDPFYDFWRSHREGGVASLREILPPADRDGYYRRVFHRRQAQIDDELGLFLPADGEASIGLFLERSRGVFSPGERSLALAVFPALVGLHRAHQRAATGPARRARSIEKAAISPAVEAMAKAAVLDSGILLTPREREIVTLILQGHPSVSIARRLGISRGTVKNHRRRLYQKLDITSERELFVTFLGRPLNG
jgi:DNA-binding CsgD family transcriptional regulator